MSDLAIAFLIGYLAVGVLLSTFGTGYAINGLRAQLDDGKVSKRAFALWIILAILVQFVVVGLFYPLVIAFQVGAKAREESREREQKKREFEEMKKRVKEKVQ